MKKSRLKKARLWTWLLGPRAAAAKVRELLQLADLRRNGNK